MACGTFTESKVPLSDLQHRVAVWNASNPTSVTWAPDPDGTYTITIVYPPCNTNTTHSADNGS